MVATQVNPELDIRLTQQFKVRNIKILLLSLWYPLSMSRYFEKALRVRRDVDLITVGPYSGAWIPWMGGMSLPSRYATPPDLPLPFGMDVGRVSYDLVRANLLDEWIPDLILTIDAGICWSGKPQEGIVAHVATDSHCLDYSFQRTISDKFFNMHKTYMQEKDIWLPYAFCSQTCYADSTVSKDVDAVLIGMPYENRTRLVEALRQKGVSVLFENGPIFDEYRHLNNRATIGLNWSSLQDLNCRVFELMAMRLVPVINRVPDLDAMGFVEGRHYLGFSSLEEAVEKVLYARSNPDVSASIALNAYQKVHQEDHTYDNRVGSMLKECGLVLA